MQYYYFYDKIQLTIYKWLYFSVNVMSLNKQIVEWLKKLPISFNSLPQQRELIILHFLKIIDGVERDQKENEENIRQSRSFHTITD